MSATPFIQELTANLRASKAQLQSVEQQLGLLERQEKLAKLTTQELATYPTDKVWRSCGKAFILQEKSKYIDDLKHDQSVVQEQTKTLKIKKNYLETTVEKTVDNLKAAIESK
ncbi:hypothetical protein HG536_0A01960 [Torulaspora globosa]|uniref:Prefoldin subunit 1 n=1 Tax=Torulaspora globosa TaxID=48254 RepID=A0A7G3ZA43_9SACH|nr:uncharacterized protein HG536_0A01960 [Torulaspora globosa]QLL30379.1 hypothetical protein HG536_0A01960 [Torulaspora globosa]